MLVFLFFSFPWKRLLLKITWDFWDCPCLVKVCLECVLIVRDLCGIEENTVQVSGLWYFFVVLLFFFNKTQTNVATARAVSTIIGYLFSPFLSSEKIKHYKNLTECCATFLIKIDENIASHFWMRCTELELNLCKMFLQKLAWTWTWC